jgi:hypothetical protein
MPNTTTPVPQQNDNRSIGALAGDLSREVSLLVRQEMTLAKTELRRKASAAGKDAGFVVAGGLLAYAGLLALIATVIIALAHVLPWWLSALIVGVVVSGAGGLLARKGINSLRKGDANPVPQETVQTLQDTARWAKEQVR